MLATDQIRRSLERLHNDGIIEIGHEHDKGAAAQAEPDESGDFLKIGRDGLGFETVEGLAAGAVVFLAVAGADEIGNAITKGDQAKEIALFLCRETQYQCSGNVAIQVRALCGIAGNLQTGREAGSIDDDIDFLGLFGLVKFCDGMTTAGGCLPVNGVVAVAGNVFAQFFKFATLAELAHGAHAGAIGAEEKRGYVLAFAFEIGIGAHFDGLKITSTNVPKAGGRFRLVIAAFDLEQATLRGKKIVKNVVLSSMGGEIDEQFLFAGHQFGRRIETDSHVEGAIDMAFKNHFEFGVPALNPAKLGGN